jgi:hypothetical protein
MPVAVRVPTPPAVPPDVLDFRTRYYLRQRRGREGKSERGVALLNSIAAPATAPNKEVETFDEAMSELLS